MSKSLLFVLVLVAGLAAPGTALAWGNVGHQLVCDVAYQLLSQDGKRLVGEIRSEGGLDEPQYFYETCLWPDAARHRAFKGTYNYHFVNVPEDATELDLARDCAALDCATVGIQRYATLVAKDPGTSTPGRQSRAQALRFLAHFVGDLHQPLHVGHIEDRGGNFLEVAWFGNRGSNSNRMQLHKVWDSQILHSSGHGSVDSAPTFLQRIENQDVTPWQNFDLAAWTAESHALAESHAYRYASGSKVRKDHDLRSTYRDRARPIVEQQIMKAAVRLAFLIDAAADGSLPQNMIALESP